jgi:C4-type Zn-finger protein
MPDQLNEFTNENGCPKCNNALVSAVKYTWWGGLLGPKIFHHTRCNGCGYRYNSKTRKSNTSAIVIYSAVLFGIAFAAVYLLKRSYG